ncbi:MAG: PQQ-dependent sugar dehydrogenase [Candidatus Limnocylindrales bacterium]
MTTHAARHRPSSRAAVLVLVALVASIASISVSVPASGAADFTITLSRRTSHTFSTPTQVTNAHDGTDRLFVVEQRGSIRVVKDGLVQAGYFLDIRPRVEAGGERGLLGVAFHPNFKTNRRLFAYYTRPGGDIVVSRFTANLARTRVSAETIRPVLLIEHSAASNHNGGSMAFGPDGFLYLGVGDGGGGGDPENDAQNNERNLLGKILRIDVDGTGAGPYDRYSIPRTNPFAGAVSGRNEIWAYGLRNPWRISFDRGTGALFIADVGQSRWEEVNREPAGSPGGRNYGWNVMEGSACYNARSCSLAGDTLPVARYSHDDGGAITGGHVYRGPSQTRLTGSYVFADYCSGKIWTLPEGGDTADLVLRADTTQNITSFGENEAGELFAVSANGHLHRVLAR